MNDLLAELQKRNVFRVAVAYCAVGWLIAQVADLAADNFGAPEWVMRVLLLALLLGLPIALFLAWAFELTPSGVVRAEDVPENAPKDPRSGRILNRIIIATLLLIVIGLVWDRFRLPTVPESAVATAEPDRSVAVLPFADFSPAGDQAWFADGLTDEILNALVRASDLRVASRTSSFVYRDSPLEIPAIAAELGVAHILEGSVRRSEDRVRVTAQLIRAADDSHLWSDTFDGSSADAITIQEDIALAIARALQTTTDPAELERMLAAGTRSVAAWESYLRGQQTMRDYLSSGSGNSGDTALQQYQQAAAIDPGFVEAHLGIAQLYNSHLRRTQMLRLSSVADHGQARAGFDAAMSAAAANARTADDRLAYQYLQAKADARFDDMVQLAERRTALSPEDPAAHSNLMVARLLSGDYAGVESSAAMVTAIYQAEGRETSSIYQYLHRVNPTTALALVRHDLAEVPRRRIDLYQVQRVLLYAGQPEEAAAIAQEFARNSDSPGAIAMVAIRQACAEGRVADADQIYADFLSEQGGVSWDDSNWLYLKTLGFDDEARRGLLKLDTPEDYYSLGDYLVYTTFDPADFPYLASQLAQQGIRRPPAHAIPFACER